mmetsp:Transcript_18732/g.46522  ORF Transcript_18732/g.46522 Transcript_18732/m.46522 type:complete len:461 (+) Transcript_18732:372-1754(+)
MTIYCNCRGRRSPSPNIAGLSTTTQHRLALFLIFLTISVSAFPISPLSNLNRVSTPSLTRVKIKTTRRTKPFHLSRNYSRRRNHHLLFSASSSSSVSIDSSDNNNNNDNINQHRYDSRGVKRKLPSSYDSQISQAALQDFSVKDVDMATIEEASAEQSDFISIDDHSASRHHQQHDELSSSTTQSQKPFVTIKGMVDGIRDELGPTTWNETCGNNNNNNNDNNDDHDDNLSCESYSLSRVVVECKHRMNKLLHGPRFSECIQAVVYCFMYEADDADIVQVLRTKNDATKSAIKEGSVTKYFRKVAQGHGQTEGGTVQDEKKKVIEKTTENQDIKGDGDVTDEATATKPRIEEQDKKETTENNIAMTIAIDRVSLDDPNFGHRANWKAIILPKLRQWVDAVYRIRQSDDKRYRLLTALSMVDSLDAANERKYLKAAWELVFEECDFLREGMSGERYRRETQ